MRRPAVILAAIACLASAAGTGYYVHRRDVGTVKVEDPPEAAALRAKFGAKGNSYAYEEWIIRDFFQDKRDGVFVDVGANDYKFISNTYYLETALHWSGLAVEPQKRFEADYLKYRPRTTFLPFFVDAVSNESAKMWVADRDNYSLVSSGDPTLPAEMGGKSHQIEVPTITMNDLLDGAKIKTFDFLSMDIELWEPKALAGFDINRFEPQLVCIEAHPQVRQQILDYFMRHGYTLLGKYLRIDVANLYFTPLK
jgi:FkbM family methyltransferase